MLTKQKESRNFRILASINIYCTYRNLLDIERFNEMASPYLCTFCTRQALSKSVKGRVILQQQRQSFSNTSKSQVVGPESPHFIEIPYPPQRYANYHPPVKGQLPRPKEIFPKNGPEKASPKYLELVTPETSKKRQAHIDTAAKKPKVMQNSYITWKSRMAESRRQNLRQGLTELHVKKTTEDNKRAEITAKRQQERDERLNAELPTALQRTLPSIAAELKESLKPLDPDPINRMAAKKEKYIDSRIDKVTFRAELIHELYLNAVSFILTEKQLDKAIDEEFDQDVSAQRILPQNMRLMIEEYGSEGNYAPSRYGTGDSGGAVDYIGAVLTGGGFMPQGESVQPATPANPTAFKSL